MCIYKAKQIIRIFLATVLSFGSGAVFFDILANNMVVSAASNEITINASDDEYKYVIPADSDEAAEFGIPAGYVQNNSKMPRFNKASIKAYSSPVSSEVVDAYQVAANQFINILSIVGPAPQNPSVRVQTLYVVVTDKDGTILSSKSIPKNTDGINPSMDDSSVAREYARYWLSSQNGSAVRVFYRGQLPDISDWDNRVASVTVDASNNISISYNTVSKGGYNPQQSVQMFNYIEGLNQVVAVGDLQKSSWDLKHFEVYYINNSGVYSNQRILEAPDYSEMLPGYDNEDKFLFITENNMVRTADDGLAGIVVAYDPTITRNAVVVWNPDGSIKYQYNLNAKDAISGQVSLLDADSYYFLEHNKTENVTKLQVMNFSNGEVTTLQKFPFNTKIQIFPDADTTYGTKYSFYGSIESATGPFLGIGDENSGGAVTGAMDEHFGVYNSSLISANGTIKQNVYKSIDGESYYAGGSTTATDFAEKPDGGWQTDTNAFFGSMNLIEDFAPAIKVGDPLIIDKDSNPDWDTALLNGISVTDTFDLNPNHGGYSQSWLDGRINRNPLDTDLPYDWTALGLDKTKAGPNTVTYFVTDSSMQTTADSKLVNVIALSTNYDLTKEVALDAHSFAISLDDVKNLTKEQTKDGSHGNVTAWDMLTGDNLITNTTINSNEYLAITNATTAGVYPLTYITESGGRTATNTIKVFVTDASSIVDPDNDVVLYADKFSVDLSDAATFDGAEALSAANAKAYSYSTGTEYPATTLSAAVGNINNATAPGPVNVDITYTGVKQTTKTVVASILDADTVIDADATIALHANNFTVSLSDAAGLSADAAKSAANVLAWSMNSGDDLTFRVKADAAELAAITSAQNAGLYNLTFSVQEDSDTPVIYNTITVFVTDDNTAVTDDVILFANDFTMQLADAATATSEGLKNLSNARAYRISTAEQLPDSNITADTSAVNGATLVGPVNVSFTYNDGVTMVTTAVASLIDDSTVVGDDEAIYATDFKVAASAVGGLDDAGIRVLAHAKAWSTKDGSPLDVNVSSAIVASPGTYQVTFATDAGTTITVMATVYDEDTVVDEDTDEAIYAHSFTVDAADVEGLTADSVKALAEARAWSIVDGSDVALTVNFAAIQKAAGVYDVTFATDAETVHTVKATVKDGNTVIDNGEALFATNFKVPSSEVAGLDKAAVDAKAGAKAWLLNDGEAVAFDTDFDAVQSAPGAYPVVFATTAGTTKTVYATVYDQNTVIDDEKDEAVYARDFTLTVEEAGSLTKAIVDGKAGAKAWKPSDASELGFTTNYSAIQASAGAYQVTFSTQEGTSITVTASVVDGDTVVDDETGEAIYAHNFTVDKGDVAGLTETHVITQAQAKAWKLADGTPVTVSANFVAVQAEAGAYPVVFTTDDGTTRTITVTVTDDNTIVDPDTGEAIYADHFIAGSNEVGGLTKAIVDGKAGAKAWKLSDGTAVGFNTDFAAVQSAVGAYPVNFATTAGTARSVTASIVDADTTYDLNHTAALYAKGFSVPLSDVGTLTEAIVKDSSHAAVKAWNMNSGADITAHIALDPAELNAIKSATAAKPYSLTFTVIENGEVITNIVPVFVTDDSTVVDPDNDVVLYAENFTMQLADAAAATSAQVKTLAHAKAYTYTSGAALPDANIGADVSGINAATAVGPVNTAITYTDGAATTKIVVASLVDDGTEVDDEKGEALYAHNFTIDKAAVAGIDKAGVDSLAGAKAWKLSDGSVVAFTTDFTAIKAVAGAYPVSFETTGGISKTIYASVSDSDTAVDPDEDTALYAHNFTIDKSEVGSLDKASVDTLAGAKAWKLSDGTALSFTTDFTAVLDEAGIYPVTFETTTGVTKTIKVTVADGDTIVDPDKDTALYAHGFTIDKADVAALDEAEVLALTEAKAWKLTNASALSVSADYAAVVAEVGVYPVVVTSETGVSKTVYVSVTDSSTDVDPAKDTALYAENFTVSKADAAGLDAAGVLSRSKAKAWRLSTGAEVAVSADMGGFVAEAGVYPLTISSDTGVSKTIYVTVTDDNTVVDGEEAIYAHDFSIESTDVASLDDAKITLLAEAKAWNINDGTTVPFTIDFSEVAAEAGTYTVTFATAAGTEKTIQVTVTDDNTVINGDVALYAHSFTMNLDEVGSLDEATVIAKTEARAWNITDSSPVSTSADYSSVIAKAGAYPVIITTADGTTRTVYASVLDDKTVVTGDVAVRADNFDLLVSEVAGLSDAQVRERAGFEAWLVSGGQDVSGYFTVDYSQVKAAAGSYAVTFDGAAVQAYSGELISRTVIANVTADPVNPDLPITGSNQFEVAIVGLLSVIVGAALVIRRKNK